MKPTSLTTEALYRATVALSTTRTTLVRSTSSIGTTLTCSQSGLVGNMRHMSTKNVPAPKFPNLPGSEANDLRYREIAMCSHKRCDQARSV
jgi:hypothetical protein